MGGFINFIKAVGQFFQGLGGTVVQSALGVRNGPMGAVSGLIGGLASNTKNIMHFINTGQQASASDSFAPHDTIKSVKDLVSALGGGGADATTRAVAHAEASTPKGQMLNQALVNVKRGMTARSAFSAVGASQVPRAQSDAAVRGLANHYSAKLRVNPFTGLAIGDHTVRNALMYPKSSLHREGVMDYVHGRAHYTMSRMTPAGLAGAGGAASRPVMATTASAASTVAGALPATVFGKVASAFAV